MVKTQVGKYAIAMTLCFLFLLLLDCFLKTSRRKQLVYRSLFAMYLFAVLWTTLLSRTPENQRFALLMPFHSYPDAWAGYLANCGDGLRDGTITAIGKLRSFLYAYNWLILNTMLFIPVGFLGRRAFPQVSWIKLLCCSALGSVLIEATQYVFRLGCLDVDDLIHNVAGVALGCFLSALFAAVGQKRKNHTQPEIGENEDG